MLENYKKRSYKYLKSKNNISTTFFSLAIVFTLSTNYFYIIGRHFGISRSGSIAIFLSIILIIAGLLFANKLKIKNYPYLLLFNIIIFAVYTFLQVDYSSMTFNIFIAFSFVPMIALMGNYSEEKVVRYTCYLIPTTLIVMGDLFKSNENYGFDQMEMGFSYAILYMLVACVIHFSFFKQKSNLYMKFCYALGFCLIFRVILLATRGTIVSLLVLFVAVILIKYNKDGKYIKPTIGKKVISILTLFLLILTINYIDVIIEPLYSFINNTFDIIPAFINKTYLAIMSGDISRGRNELIAFTVDRIKEKPLLGHGALTFKSYHGIFSYPHNCFLQLMFENGIAGSILPILSTCYGIWCVSFCAKENGRSKTAFFLLILLSAFPMLLMSSEMWITPAFWMSMICGGRMFIERTSLQPRISKLDG